ncbi:MAG: stage III sporulation protein AE [Alicyclobacillaceae bacterium]|jgi:stage III sporulation protein AE|uniref:stage III sporulation protein AE n=1 Tax=Alicyclobacillus sp. SP_1 TaxID=2942475 RepID=UPI0021579C1C|nr:stage III sporulation protein AE [Alicyclobacillus sp. SP_1]MCY0888947.1 stage III sporulation protein AE [Alicyclobacillaceae bacterium]
MRRVSLSQGLSVGLTCSLTLVVLLLAHTPTVFANGMAASGIDALHRAAGAQLDHLPTQEIDQFWQHLQQQYGGYLPDDSGPSLIKSLLDGGFQPKHLISGLTRYFLSSVVDHARLVGGILILTVVAAVLETMQAAFEQQTVSRVAYAVIFLVLLVLAIGSFTEAIATARHAIETMDHFMLATIPLSVALLAASGSLASAAFFQPMMLFTVHFITNLVFFIVFPLVFFSAILDVTSTLSETYRLTRLASLMRASGLTILGLALSGFLGVITIQGVGKGIVDGVGMRVVKFSVGTFVPVIGKAVSDAAETVLTASLLVRNAIGVAGLVIIAGITIFPALKILAMSFLYSGSAALMQPLGDSPMLSCLGTLAKSMLLLFACVMAVGVMFFLAVCILLAASNLAVVMA